MSHLRAVYEQLSRSIACFNSAEESYDGGKLAGRFEGRCGFTGREIGEEQSYELYDKYARYAVRGVSYECSVKKKDMHGFDTTKVVAKGFLPIKQQKIEVPVTRSGVDEFIRKQNKGAWIGNNIPAFVILLLLLTGLGVALFFISLYYIFPFFLAMPAGGLYAFGSLIGIGIMLPLIAIGLFISWFVKKRKIKKAGTDINRMTDKQRAFIEGTIEENVDKKIKQELNQLWHNPKKDDSIIKDDEWTWDSHICVSRYDYRLVKEDMQENIDAIMDNMAKAAKDRELSEDIVSSKLWSADA